MRFLARVLTLVCALFFSGIAALPLRSSAQAAPDFGGPGALRVRACLTGAHRDLRTAQGHLANGAMAAMNGALGRAVVELERAAVLLRPGGLSPASEVVTALLVDFTTTDLAEDPEVAAMLLERGIAELAGLLSLNGAVDAQSGGAGRLILNPPGAEFGILCPNEEREVQVQVTNKSTVARTLDFRLTAADPLALTEDSPKSVAPGETVTVTIRFKYDRVGRFRRAYMLHAEAPGMRDIGVFVTASATIRNVLVDPNPLDFDEVTIGETRKMRVTVKNCLDQEIQAQVGVARNTSFQLAEGQPIAVTLPAAGSIEVELAFTPKVVPEVTAVFQVVLPSNRFRPEVISSANLKGRGKEPVKVGARTLNFGTVAAGQFHTRTVGIENNTNVPQEVMVDRTRLHTEFWSVSPNGAVKLPPKSVTLISLRFGAIGRCQHRGTLVVKSSKLRGGKASVAVNVLSR